MAFVDTELITSLIVTINPIGPSVIPVGFSSFRIDVVSIEHGLRLETRGR
jgi:hypothetical protein